MTNDKCINCGGDKGIHHYQTSQCPVGGREAPLHHRQEWKTTIFSPVPLTPSDRLARDMTIREHFAALIMQGFCSHPALVQMPSIRFASISVEHADTLIEALNKEAK